MSPGGFVRRKESARIGFIGISGRGSGMLDLLLQVDGVTVPAVCDLIPERAEKGIEIVEKRNEKAYPVHAYLDYKEMFEKWMNSKVVDESKGKYSELSYEVISRDKNVNLTLVDISLKTGRHHQIRVQVASRNHALYGDQRYGLQDKQQIALHAYKLEFIHPTTKEKMVFISKPKKESKWSNFDF